MERTKENFLRAVIEDSMDRVKRAKSGHCYRAKLVFVDFIITAASGPLLDEKAREFSHKMAAGEGKRATILGLWRRTGLLNAMMANAFSSHATELDDWLPSGFFHAASTVIPPLLAFSEDLSFTLEDLVEAIMFGYEVGARIGSLLGRSHFRVWHPTSTVGGAASASALAYMLSDGNPEEVGKALAISLGYAGGLWKVIMSDVFLKPASAVHAVMLAYLSNEMRRAVRPPLPRSLPQESICKALHGECNVSRALNPPWGLAIEEVSLKLYPVARNIQTVVQACERLCGRIDANRIEKVVVETFYEAYQVADIENPESVDEARYSLKFIASLALLRGLNGLSSIKLGLRDPLVRSLEKKVEVVVREDFSMLYPHKQPVKVSVHHSKGSPIEVYEDEPLGKVSGPSAEEVVCKKARMLATETGDTRLAVIPDFVRRLSMQESVRGVMEHLT